MKQIFPLGRNDTVKNRDFITRTSLTAGGNETVQMQVSMPIVKATTKCAKGFSCLSGCTDCMCWASYASKYPFVEVKHKSVDSCAYLLQYGNATYCLCPTRNAIYTHYQV